MSTDKQQHQVIADWVGDVVALESHVEEALDHQLKLEHRSAAVTSAIQRFHDTVKASKERAVAYEESYGSDVSNTLVQKGSEILGKAAGLIDRMRDDSASKALRDDFTAFAHTAMAYQMLHATAMALGDSATEAFAGEGLKTYAALVQDVNQVISEAVIVDLADNDDYPNVDTSVIDHCRDFINSAWQQTSN